MKVKIILMDSSDDEENFDFQHWSDWQPSNSILNKTLSNEKNSGKTYVYDKNFEKLIHNIKTEPKFGTWIPPVNFCKEAKTISSKILTIKTENIKEKDTEVLEVSARTILSREVREIDNKFKWKKTLNPDWGERIELYDLERFNNGDLIWGFVNLDVFVNIKLWVNEYGNICGSADGTISKICSREKAMISIGNAQLLRKMLNVSTPHWLTICDLIQQSKVSLKFEAFENVVLDKMPSIEKLWFFICSKRFFLPYRCMLGKVNGAIKCFKSFQVIPKFVVEDIRNEEGEEII